MRLDRGRKGGREGDIINTHAQWASRKVYVYIPVHGMCMRYASPGQPAHVINDIPDRDGLVHMYVHHENRSLIQSLMLMCWAIKPAHVELRHLG